MKKIINLIMIVVLLQTVVTAQCNIGWKEIVEKYTDGIYLTHQVFENNTDKNYEIVLNHGVKYAIYLLNPSKSIPGFKLIGDNELPFRDFEAKFNREENYAAFIFTANKSGKYRVALDFGTKEKACVLFVLSFISKKKKK
jgi:hypothetical protein